MTAMSLRPGEVVRVRDALWRITRLVAYEASAIVEARGCGRSNRGAVARFLLPAEPCERLPAPRAPRMVGPPEWRRLARGLLAGARSSFVALRAAAYADVAVLPFQLEPAMALARGVAARILVADDVGLGKTIQAGLAIADLVERVHEPHVLVVVPAALREQWQDELSRRFGVPAVIADAAAVGAGAAAPAGANPWAVHPVLIASIDYVKRPEAIRGVEALVWDLVVFDEAHVLSTRSDRHHAAAALAERARAVLLLTATPHSGRDEDFARLCGLGDLEARFPLLVFRRTKADAGLAGARRTTCLSVRPTPPEARVHAALQRYTRLVWQQKGRSSADARLVAMILTRRACSSTASLSQSLERRLALMTTDPGQQLRLPLDEGGDDAPDVELSAPGLDDIEDERRQLSALLALARAAEAHDSKLTAVRRLLRRAGEPAILFTEYRDTLRWLAVHLADFEPVLLHGDLPASGRREALRQFSSGRARLLLATDAASEGLNLHQRCRLVINLEVPWTPRRLDQRVGRVDRIGQLRRVHEVHLMGAGTCEEATLAALSRRRERIQDALAGLRGSPVTEQDVARAVFEDGPDAPAGRDASLPTGVFTHDLRDAAAREAEDIVLARRLRTAAPPGDGRAFACAVRSRGRPRRVYCTFSLEFTDAAGGFLWDTLLPLEVRLLHEADTVPPGPYLERLCADVDIFAREQQLATARSLESQLRSALELATSRETCIARAARERQARMAVALAQGTLFSRRPPHGLSDQAAALRDLLEHSHARLERLRCRMTIRPGSREPAFVLMRVR